MIYDVNFFQDNPKHLTLDSPIEAHFDWVAKKILLTAYKVQKPYYYQLKRPIHGAQHAGRCALYMPIIANLLIKYGDKDAVKLSPRWLKLLQIAALFHDSGREADGEDKWEKDSATNLYFYLTTTLKLAHEDAKILAEALLNKDYKPPFCTIAKVENNTLIWKEELITTPKPFYCKMIAMPDCLDIMRAEHFFDATYLDFHKDYVIPDSNEHALNDMAIIITHIRSLLETQGDLRRKHNYKTKMHYEQEPDKFIERTLRDICHGLIPGTTQLIRKSLADLYNNGLLLTETEAKKMHLRETSTDPIAQSLENGTLFARGIRTPAAIRFKTEEKLAKIIKTDKRHQETLAQCEIRKNSRALINSGKIGNRNRSTVLLGWGILTYAPAGFLLQCTNNSKIKFVDDCNSSSGYGKKNELEAINQHQITKELAKLQYSMKMGGLEIDYDFYIANHNEVVMNIENPMIKAIYYTLDSNLINTRFVSEDGFPIHANAPILEALYIQKEYFLKTGIHLPIYEYSAVHNFIQKRAFDENKIINLWRELISYHIDHLNNMRYVHNNSYCIDQLKIQCMYRASPYRDILQPVDTNYEPDLKAKISGVIQEIIKEYELFAEVAANNTARVGSILESLYQLPNRNHIDFLNKRNANGRTALSFARSEMMAELIKGKIMLSTDDYLYISHKLREYAQNGDLEAVKALVSIGSNLNEIDANGNSALILAKQQGHKGVVTFLTNAGAQIPNRFGLFKSLPIPIPVPESSVNYTK
ncbi:MAG: SidE phosphodiesterase domain-containing protein [Legionella sp.]|jgi:hypothetical protein